MKELLLLLTLLFLSCHSTKKPLPIQFFKETVHLTVNKDEVAVKGHYYLRNRTDTSKIMKLFYPFPIDNDHLYPYYIEVEGIPFKKEPQGISFKIKIKPLETREVIIKYKQRVLTSSAKYILTTARKWNEPIEDANFILDIPKSFKPKISYRSDSTITKGDRSLYYISRKNLFPDRDLDIEWNQSEDK